MMRPIWKLAGTLCLLLSLAGCNKGSKECARASQCCSKLMALNPEKTAQYKPICDQMLKAKDAQQCTKALQGMGTAFAALKQPIPAECK